MADHDTVHTALQPNGSFLIEQTTREELACLFGRPQATVQLFYSTDSSDRVSASARPLVTVVVRTSEFPSDPRSHELKSEENEEEEEERDHNVYANLKLL
jgi:hypothetical protein